VEVKPNLPTITGSRRHRNYYADYTDFDKLLLAYVDTYNSAKTSEQSGEMLKRREFLRKFIIEDQMALGKFARDTQDSAKVMQLVPGVKAWDRDRT